MPSPFPGMDPYLEDKTGWTGVHNRLIVRIGDYLAGVVDPGFIVEIEERVYITHPIDDPGYPSLVPDITVAHAPLSPYAAAPAPSADGLDLAIAPPVVVETDLGLDIHDSYLSILDAQSREVVTAIEVLSPANKVRGARGYAAMREKQRLLRQGHAHLMEIDLLRGGERVQGVSGKSDYCVTLLRSDISRLHAWFFNLRDVMPVVGVPLRAPYSDLPLPLQQIINEVYDNGRYAQRINYHRPVPPPALRPADDAWVKQIVRDWQAVHTSQP